MTETPGPLTHDMPAADTPGPDPVIAAMPFDRALAELRSVVGRLETGGLPLEGSIELYERGVALQARCERLIRDAELRVEQLVARAGGALETRAVQPEKVADGPPDQAAPGSR